MERNPTRIVCAAIRHRDSEVIICSARHYDPIMRKLISMTGGSDYWLGCEQGFIDQRGNFLDREDNHSQNGDCGDNRAYSPNIAIGRFITHIETQHTKQRSYKS